MFLCTFALVFLINSLELELKYGPNIPMGNLNRNYKTTSAISSALNFNNLQLAYSFTKFPSKISYQEHINWHEIALVYNYPFIKKQHNLVIALFGGNYNYFLRRMLRAEEKTYAFGLKYGLGYKQKFTGGDFVDKIKPALLAQIYLNQVIQARDWNYNQIMTSNFFLLLSLGVSFQIL